MYEEFYANTQDETKALERLMAIIRALRAPEGCPWDREQTHESLTRCLVEEAYEVLEAIEKKDRTNLKEELGDVLLQVVMHGQIAEEAGEFSMADIANAVSEKMLRRHPHVFAKKDGENLENKPLAVDNVLELWENVKQGEKKTFSEADDMRNVPRHLPALLRSEKIQAKAKRVGFDWDDVSEAFLKIREETLELEEAYSLGDKNHIREELGDLLFAVVNVARFLDIDPEEALNLTSQKFIQRFSYVESQARIKGRKLTDMTLPEMDELWEEAKTLEY